MRFTAVWALTLTQNITLRIVLVALSVATLVLATSTVRLAVRDPLIVERGCVSTAAKPGPVKHTNDEIEAFVRQAIPKRFDSKTSESQLVLTVEEQAFRSKEQQELNSRGISQRVVVNEITIEGTTVRVDADRILTASNLRTAVAFPVTLELAQTDRTPANPYGLVVSRVSQAKPKEELK